MSSAMTAAILSVLTIFGLSCLLCFLKGRAVGYKHGRRAGLEYAKLFAKEAAWDMMKHPDFHIYGFGWQDLIHMRNAMETHQVNAEDLFEKLDYANRSPARKTAKKRDDESEAEKQHKEILAAASKIKNTTRKK